MIIGGADTPWNNNVRKFLFDAAWLGLHGPECNSNGAGVETEAAASLAQRWKGNNATNQPLHLPIIYMTTSRQSRGM